MVGCGTYRQDLVRVKSHYDASEFPQALALLRVLEQDVDALSPSEQVQYAYMRGMTDYRLSEAAPRGNVRDEFRKYAGFYLHVTLEWDRRGQPALTDEQRARVNDTLALLANDGATNDGMQSAAP